MAIKRELKIETFEDVKAEVRRLYTGGYSIGGNWDLAQICGHLDYWMRCPMDGYPRNPLPLRVLFAVVRGLSGKRMLRKILEKGFPDGGPTIPASIPARGVENDERAAEKLCATIDRFKTFSGQFQPSPIFGAVDRESWRRLMISHCRHHLQFLIPHKSGNG